MKAMVNTMHKTMAKKVRLVTTKLPMNFKSYIKKAKMKLGLKKTRKIRHNFIEESLAKLKIRRSEFLKELKKKKFQEMIFKHDKAFCSLSYEIRCVNSKIVTSMVIFTISHVSSDLKPIPMLKA